jgi:arylsulfatase A-like enzyme
MFPRPLSRTKLHLAAGLSFLLSAIASCGGGSGSESTTPHVFLIVADAGSAAYFGCYGGEGDTSPNLDRLAEDGVLFEVAYGQSSFTATSVASIFTGRLPVGHKVFLKTRLSESHRTMAEILSDAGYRTSGIFGNPFAGSPARGMTQGFDRSVEVYALPEIIEKREIKKPFVGAPPYRVTLPMDITERAIAELPAPGDPPAFLYLHYLQPHRPYDPPAEYVEPYLPAGDRSGLMTWSEVSDAIDRANEGHVPVPGLAELARAYYRGTIRYLDDGVGAFLDRLREAGLYEDSLIIFTSDHGDAFAEHGLFGHSLTIYDDMVRVPLIVKFPRSMGLEEMRLSTSAEGVDLLPTILDVLGLEPPPHLSGESLLPFVQGTAEELEYPDTVLAAVNRMSEGMRFGRYKLLLRSNPRSVELFDLEEDPGETRDLSRERPDLVDVMMKRFVAEQQRALHGSVPEEPVEETDERALELLRKLGYAGEDG